MRKPLLQALRWTARITGPLVLAYFAFAVLVGSQAMDGLSPACLSFSAVGLAILGYMIAWFWEGVGGAMMVAAGVGLAVVLGDQQPFLPASTYLFTGGPFLIAGTLFLVCWWMERRQGNKRLRR